MTWLVNPQSVAETVVDWPLALSSTVPCPLEIDEKTAVLEIFQVT
jgi:hypothetical protein